MEYAWGVYRPALPEWIERYILGLYSFNKSLTAWVSGSENGFGPELVCNSLSSYYLKCAS